MMLHHLLPDIHIYFAFNYIPFIEVYFFYRMNNYISNSLNIINNASIYFSFIRLLAPASTIETALIKHHILPVYNFQYPGIKLILVWVFIEKHFSFFFLMHYMFACNFIIKFW